MIKLAYRLLTVSMLIIVINGCATMSKDECMVADWRAIGYEDGSRGFSEQQFSEHRKACAEYGVAANFDRYQDGHRDGVKSYCVPRTTFRLGSNGSSLNPVCTTVPGGPLIRAYNQGREVYKVKSEKAEVDRLIRALSDEVSDLEHEMAANEEVIIADSTSPSIRKELLEQNRAIERIIADKIAEREDLYPESDRLQRKINRMLKQFGY